MRDCPCGSTSGTPCCLIRTDVGAARHTRTLEAPHPDSLRLGSEVVLGRGAGAELQVLDRNGSVFDQWSACSCPGLWFKVNPGGW